MADVNAAAGWSDIEMDDGLHIEHRIYMCILCPTAILQRRVCVAEVADW
jgi:hypothetical protein